MPSETAAKVDIGALASLAGYHLRRASTAFAVDFARALHGTQIRQVPFAILSVVAANPGISQGAVGRALGIQRANMVTLVIELVDRDLVARSASNDDRRLVALALTAAGTATLAACLALIRAHEEAMLGPLSPLERRQLSALLGKIAERDFHTV